MVAAARDILETEGPDALTMRRVAARLGMKEPSLYKHCRSREELLAAVVASGMRDLAEGWRRAVEPAADAADALSRLAAHQREFAARHPHLY
jgi:AcrR family transcriptional regulator